MDRVISINLFFGVLLLLPLHGVISVQGRSLLTPGKQILPHTSKADIQRKIVALWLQKTLEPIDRNDALEFQLSGKEEDPEELERQIISMAGKEHSKRGEACFWKYCV